eukprot:gene33404-41926_t
MWAYTLWRVWGHGRCAATRATVACWGTAVVRQHERLLRVGARPLCGNTSDCGANGQRCSKVSDAYGPSENTRENLELNLTVTTAAITLAPAPRKETSAPILPTVNVNRGWIKNVTHNKEDAKMGDLPGRWTCPGCSTTFRLISEWRCARCGTPQPGAEGADPGMMRSQMQRIEPMAKILDIDKHLLYSAHPGDMQVLIDARIERDDDCHTPKETVLTFLALLPYRSSIPDDIQAAQEITRRCRLPMTVSAGLKALDATGMRRLLCEYAKGKAAPGTAGRA